MSDESGYFRMPVPYSPSAGGLRTLVERSPHVEAVARLGDLATFVRLPRLHPSRPDRAEARRRLEILPKTSALEDARSALVDALDGHPASGATTEMLMTAACEVIPLPRPVRKREFIDACKVIIVASSGLLASTLRNVVASDKTMPSTAELVVRIGEESKRLEAAVDLVLRTMDIRDEAIVALDWTDPKDRAFLAQVGDQVPHGDGLDDDMATLFGVRR